MEMAGDREKMKPSDGREGQNEKESSESHF